MAIARWRRVARVSQVSARAALMQAVSCVPIFGTHFLSKASLVRVLLVSTCVLGTSFSTAVNGQASEVDLEQIDHLQAELGYRVGLYEYYQGDPLAALTFLEVDKVRVAERSAMVETVNAKDRADAHHDQIANARLLEAGIRLGYGLHRSARALLSQLVASPTLSEQGYAEATLYLAQWLYLHQQPDAALRVLKDIGSSLPEEQAQQAAYLEQLLAVKTGRSDVSTNKDAGPWQPYLLYNQAIGYAQSDDNDKAQQTLEQALTLISQGRAVEDDSWLDLLAWSFWFPPTPLPLSEQELQSLQDRVHLTRARLYRQQEDYPSAVDAYRQVSIEGMAAPEAMFSYGWTAFNAGDQPLSLKAWSALAQREDLTAEMLQVHLAIAWSYEQWGMQSQALNSYQQAAQSYQQILAELQSQIDSLAPEALMSQLLPDTDETWLSDQGIIKVASLPRLDPLMISQQMQARLIDARDLRLLQRNLLNWQRNMEQFDDMLEVRQLSREAQLAEIQAAPPQAEFDTLKAARDQIAAQVAQAEQDPEALATDEELAILKRLKRAEQTLSQLKEHPKYAQYAERLRRVRGTLDWQLRDDLVARQWQQTKSLKELDNLLRESEQRLTRLQRIVDTPSEQLALQQRVTQAQQDLTQQLLAVNSTYVALRQEIFNLVLGDLKRQHALVKEHLAQSQLAITRLYEHYLKIKQQQAFPQAAPAPSPATEADKANPEEIGEEGAS
ncbi:hypothetical protein ACFSJ3_18425 [Corallincola platygyrae]|uniref:Tetratricopeptide repeat protein n=1 Tax=Corallincola platygyrae TaxID=1193278 RepID=A0ABW4XVQ3_9GAMM